MKDMRGTPRKKRSGVRELLVSAACALFVAYLTMACWKASVLPQLVENPWLLKLLLVACTGSLAVLFLPAVCSSWACALLISARKRGRRD